MSFVSDDARLTFSENFATDSNCRLSGERIPFGLPGIIINDHQLNLYMAELDAVTLVDALRMTILFAKSLYTKERKKILLELLPKDAKKRTIYRDFGTVTVHRKGFLDGFLEDKLQLLYCGESTGQKRALIPSYGDSTKPLADQRFHEDKLSYPASNYRCNGRTMSLIFNSPEDAREFRDAVREKAGYNTGLQLNSASRGEIWRRPRSADPRITNLDAKWEYLTGLFRLTDAEFSEKLKFVHTQDGREPTVVPGGTTLAEAVEMSGNHNRPEFQVVLVETTKNSKSQNGIPVSPPTSERLERLERLVMN